MTSTASLMSMWWSDHAEESTTSVVDGRTFSHTHEVVGAAPKRIDESLGC